MGDTVLELAMPIKEINGGPGRTIAYGSLRSLTIVPDDFFEPSICRL